jgi:hypothetical protein
VRNKNAVFKGRVADILRLERLRPLKLFLYCAFVDVTRSSSCAAAEAVFREDSPSTTTKLCITKELTHDGYGLNTVVSSTTDSVRNFRDIGSLAE